jgi:AcrR family transcriptional regulator
VGELSDRRARKKAQTREHIRSTAHALFAERGFEPVTVADVAATADVAVQTVFNHFPTKEELFFADRGPLAHEPADAVRNRPAGLTPLAALRQHLADRASRFVAWHVTPEGRSYVRAIDASPALALHEQRVIHEAEQQLSAALAEAWETDPEPWMALEDELDTGLLAPLTAATWMAAIRVVVVEQRRIEAHRADPAAAAAAVQVMADRLLASLQDRPHRAAEPVTGWPLERVG